MTDWPTIAKSAHDRERTNMGDYEAFCTSFDWHAARSALSSLPRGGGLNIAHEAVDRHVDDGKGGRVAIRWLGKHDTRRELTYSELAQQSSRFASALAGLGVREGDRVYSLLGGCRRPQSPRWVH